MDRFTRNILIPDVGKQGQEKLKKAKVLVVGAGGLGSPVLYYLAAAGVGTIGIIDNDMVDITNLQRQIIHHTGDIGKYKVLSASEKLKKLYPDIEINTYAFKFTKDNATDLVANYDFIIDCCDNYKTKFLINDICVQCSKPYSHGAVSELRGEVMTFIPNNANYRNVHENIPCENKTTQGIMGSVAGVIGCLQATEAIKYITGVGELIVNRILIFDAVLMNFYSLKINF